MHNHCIQYLMHIVRVYSFVSFTVPPRVTYRDDDDGNATLESGQRLSVLCDANHPDANSSTSITKEWKKDGEALSNESQLVIESLSPKDSGIYTCSASFDGLENKKSFHLTVVGKYKVNM